MIFVNDSEFECHISAFYYVFINKYFYKVESALKAVDMNVLNCFFAQI